VSRHSLAILSAFAAVYVVWGSTYLAIRIGVATLPPWLMAGARMGLAAAVLLGVAALRGERWPSGRVAWLRLTVLGTLLLVGGNGLMSWALLAIPSGQGALIAASSALWIAVLAALGSSGESLSARTIVGLLCGLIGVGALVFEGITHLHGEAELPPTAYYAAALVGALSWSTGSVFAKRHPVHAGVMTTVGLQSGIACILMTSIGLMLGEAGRWQPTAQGIGAIVYLALFGSCVGFLCFYWLARQVSAAALGTYAYVNPAVAVLLGWWVLDEQLGPWQWAGMLIILLGVGIISTGRRAAPEPAPASEAA